MRGSRSGPAARTALLAGVAALALTLTSEPVRAQQPAVAADAARTAFDIPAQDLNAALLAFARQTRVQLFYDVDKVRGLNSPGVSGRFTLPEALDRLLAGTGVTHRFTGSGSVTLERAAADGALVLSPVTVEALGRPQTAWGPTDGFVATRSAAGTKTDTPLLETPQSVTVVTRAQIEAQRAETVPQALRYAPGVLTDRNGADQRSDYLFSRGFAVDQYLDGTRLLAGTWTLPQVEAYGVERIDVLKGPASVLYGQGSPGGVASIVTKKPQEQAFGQVTVQTGSHERKQAGLDMGGPVTADRSFLYRLTALVRDTETQIDQTKEQRLYIAPAVTWRPGDDTTLTLQASYTRDPRSGAYYKLPARGTVLPNPNGEIPRSFYSGDPNFEKHERTQYTVGWQLEHRVNDAVTLRQNARYMNIEGDYRILVVGTLAPNLRTINRSAYAAKENTDAFAIDNQAQATFATGALAHTLVGGVDYQRTMNDRRDAFGAAPGIDFVNPVYGQRIADPTGSWFLDNDQDIGQLGLYLQDQIKLDRLSLVLGGRYDWARSETRDRLTGTTTEQSDREFTGRAALIYNFDMGVAPYVSYSESFQPTAGTDFFGTPFKPTTGRQYEAGVKVQPAGTETLVTLSAFHLTQQNVLTSDPDPSHPFSQVQTGEVRTRGIELDVKATLAEGLTLIGSYALLDAEVTKSNDGTEGRTPVYQPRHMASLWGDYAVRAGSLAGFGVGLGVRYFGETYGDAMNTFKVPSYTVVDAALRYDLGQLSRKLTGTNVAVNASNLFDKEYVADCQNINTCYYGMGRTVFATLTYNW